MPRRSDLLAATTLGALVNFPWEMAHSLLYRNTVGFTWKQHLLCCGGASLLDGVGIAIIFGTGAAAFREARWTRHCSVARLGLTALLGFTGTVITEWLALRGDWWEYQPAMPRLPGTELGISPLAQFIVLPWGVLFWALPRWWDWREGTDVHADV